MPIYKLRSPGLAACIAVSLTLAACSTDYPMTQTDEPAASLSCDLSDPWIESTLNAGDSAVFQGVVSGLFLGSEELGGMFIQRAATGGEQTDPTMNALFLATPDTSLVPAGLAVGDVVTARGELAEFQGGWQLRSEALLQCGQGSIDHHALTFPVSDITQFEKLIHQPVHIEQPMYVVDHYNLARFGITTIASELLWNPTQKVAPGEPAQALAQQNQRARIVLDDGSNQEYPSTVKYPQPGLDIDNPLRRGDRVENIHAIVVKMGNSYHLHPTQAPQFEQHNPRPQPEVLRRQGDLRVVAFNVLNYFNGDGQGGGFPTPRGAKSAQEFERQHARLVAAMAALDADIYTLMEVENDGFDELSAIATLTRGLQDALPDTQWAYVNPGVDRVGGDVITQGMIYRADTVSELGTATFSEDPIFALGSRPPFAQRFVVKDTGGEITVVANHFKSKGRCPGDGSADDNQSDGQGCWNALRTQSAQALAEWVANDIGADTPGSFLLTGDFNAYAMEDPLQQLSHNDYVNLATLYAPDGYSYVFRGEAGSLDHMMAHISLLPAVQHFGYWSVNADEPVAFEYPLQNKSPQQQQSWYAPSPYRSSDHDPIWVDFNSHLLPRSSAFSPQ